jgi:DNA-binding NtrC family response regulator
MPPRVLVIEERVGLLDAGLLAPFEATRVAWEPVEPVLQASGRHDLIVPVVSVFSEGALRFFKWLQEQGCGVPTLAVFNTETPCDALNLGLSAVDDFVSWPVRLEEWRQRISRLVASRDCAAGSVRDRLTCEVGLTRLLGQDQAFLDTLAKIPIVARSGSPALITGETGTGKELCARAIHHVSDRRNQPFVPVDCAALPDNLFENELFGHTRGAFTDAHRDQKGLVALADKGTLFLDEIDSLSPSAQAKLLRLLQEKTYRPLGSEKFVKADLSVLAAMNRDPVSLVEKGQFRSDLFFRLNVFRLHLGPLRERRADIPILARYLVETTASEMQVGPKALTPAALRKLMGHGWPGNVRELGNVIQRAVLLAHDRNLLPDHVVFSTEPVAPVGTPVPAETFRQAKERAIKEFESSYVSRLFEKHGGNVTHAAREAQKDRRAFGRLLKKHGARHL